MNAHDEIEAFAILLETPFLGPIKIRLLIKYFGSAQAAIEASSNAIEELPGFAPKITQHWGWWKNSSVWKKNLEMAEKDDIHLIPFTSPDYPKSLLQLPDLPILLYVKGKLKTNDRQSIGIVGTRCATRYGMAMAETLSRDLASQGFTVISGLARGIDTAAHRGALQTGRTLAIIGSGLAHIYPKENKELADHISTTGALISEFPMTTPPDRKNFPRRNRIISGMAMAALLVEAPEKSGAMHTMARAWQEKKPLFCIPGPVGENFAGNHLLIKTGKAQLIENACDINCALGQLFPASEKRAKKLTPPLEKEEEDMLQHLSCEEFSLEDIMQLTKLPIRKINILLMGLLLKQVIKEYPGKIYKKC